MRRISVFAWKPISRRSFTVLAFESSADDTAVAVVRSDRAVLSNVVIKQHAHHEQYGGIQPSVAISWHQRNLPFAVKRALEGAKMEAVDVNGIAFTRGPGMGGCLAASNNAAKSLAAALGKPIVGVHHMQAHALTPLLTSNPPPEFPFLTLLVSGGHTLVLLARSPHSFKQLSTTLDLAIGNVYDRCSKYLEIPPDPVFGRGAALEYFARTIPSTPRSTPTQKYPFLPLIYQPSCRGKLESMSFTGLDTAVRRLIEGSPEPLTDDQRLHIVQAFQDAAASLVCEKVRLALRWCSDHEENVTSLVASGGVASNLYLRERLQQCVVKQEEWRNLPVIFPPPELCTDNAVMIGWASMYRFLEGRTDDYSIEPRSKWSIEDLGDDFA